METRAETVSKYNWSVLYLITFWIYREMCENPHTLARWFQRIKCTFLFRRGHADAEIEAVFAKYDVDGDRILSIVERRKMQDDLEGQKVWTSFLLHSSLIKKMLKSTIQYSDKNCSKLTLSLYLIIPINQCPIYPFENLCSQERISWMWLRQCVVAVGWVDGRNRGGWTSERRFGQITFKGESARRWWWRWRQRRRRKWRQSQTWNSLGGVCCVSFLKGYVFQLHWRFSWES